VCLPFIALMALFNSLIQSSKLSVVFTIILLPIVNGFITYFSSYVAPLEYLLYALPGVQITDTIQMANFQISSVITPVAQTVVYLGLAQTVLARRAL